ncbi:MAG: hypothetical protein Q9183_000298 [Haloplaca sp. 2 TL-2023]
MQSKPPGDVTASLVATILTCYRELLRLPNLRPSSTVDGLFGNLVEVCCSTLDEEIVKGVLTHPRIIAITNPLRQLCSDGEFQLEAHWANLVMEKKSGEEANETLLNFTYYNNYRDLTRMEWNALASATAGRLLEKFVVLGCGPLPMTSICIAEMLKSQGGAVVLSVDRDPWAVSKSSELCGHLGYGLQNMNFTCFDVQHGAFELYDFDVVYLASLVGLTDIGKLEAVKCVVKAMRPGAILVLRSAHALRGLLYPVSLARSASRFHTYSILD